MYKGPLRAIANEAADRCELDSYVKYENKGNKMMWGKTGWVKDPRPRKVNAADVIEALLEYEVDNVDSLRELLDKTADRAQDLGCCIGGNGEINGDGLKMLVEHDLCALSEVLHEMAKEERSRVIAKVTGRSTL